MQGQQGPRRVSLRLTVALFLACLLSAVDARAQVFSPFVPEDCDSKRDCSLHEDTRSCDREGPFGVHYNDPVCEAAKAAANAWAAVQKLACETEKQGERLKCNLGLAGPWSCNAGGVIARLASGPAPEVSDLSKSVAWFTTPIKSDLPGSLPYSWRNTDCAAGGVGVLVKDAAHGSDDFYTLDLRLDALLVDGHFLDVGQTNRDLRVEVRPRTWLGGAAHEVARIHPPKANERYWFRGIVLVDNDPPRWVEVHPGDDLKLLADGEPAPSLIASGGAGPEPPLPTIWALSHPAKNPQGWNNSDVEVDFGCAAVAARVVACPGPASVTDEGRDQVVTGTATDVLGRSVATSVLVSLDKTPPSLTTSTEPVPNAAGWNRTAAKVVFDCQDGLSGIAACTPPTVLAAEGAHQVVEGRAIDNADNSATLEAVVNIDKTNPTVSLLSAVPKAKANGWNDTDVILTFECKDNVAGSGIARCPAPYTVDTEGPTQVFQGEGTDVADNIALSAPLTLNIDKTKTWNQVIGGKTYEIHPMAPTYDGDSGIFHLPTAYVLPRRAFSTGVFRDHVDRDPNALDISVLEISFGFGITDALEVFGAIGENRVRVGQASVRTSVPEFPGAASGWHTGVGDLRLGGKYALRNEYKGAPMSLALRTVVNFGNADAKDGLGAGEASLISDVAMSKNLGTTASVHGAIGYQTGRANGFRFGAGINAPAHRRLQLQAEFTGLERHDRKAAPSYVDLVVGPVLWFKPGWFVRAAFETNLNRGGRSTRNFSDFQIGVGYHFGLPWRVVKVAPPGVRIIR